MDETSEERLDIVVILFVGIRRFLSYVMSLL